jgi:subtilisin family serine protease
MKKILLFAVLAICISGYSQKVSKIDADLREEMQLRNDNELIKINIVMKAQYDQLELRSKVVNYRLKEDKRTFVIHELKNFTKETQRNVMSYLYHFAENNTVTEIKQFWIFNGITCYATKEVIEELVYLEDILIIGYDRLEKLIPDYEVPLSKEDGETRELTYNVTKVKANQVWDELGFTGEGVLVAVFDTGVNYNHNDLKTHMWTHPDYPYHGYNFANGNNNPMDYHGHGTHCAGTVAGNGTSGSQTGMAPDATIMALQVLTSSGSGQPANVCNAMEFAIEHGVHVFSMSIGWFTPTVATRLLYRNAMVNVLEAGVVASVAAGNEGNDLIYYPIPQNVRTPGDCPPPWLHPDQTTQGGLSAVVSIGATNANDQIALFPGWYGWGSSNGPVSWQYVSPYNDYPYNPGMGLIRPDVCAPGVDVKSCAYNNISGYATMSGTSMATPGVAGVMALMLQKNPEITPAQICEILETTAVHLPTATSPKGNIYGSGRIDAFEAVSAVPMPTIECDPISNLTYTLEYNKIVNFTWDRPEDDTDLTGYNIYRDGDMLIENVAEEIYIYMGEEEGEYTFCIEAVYQDCASPMVCETVNVISICAPVTDLISSVVGYEITLSWNAPELISEVLHYNIYRDDVFVRTIEMESFYEEISSGNYIYSVETEYFNECISERVSIYILILETPINLTAIPKIEETEVSIELLWEYEDETIFFNVYRDNENIASNIAEKHFADKDRVVDIEYCYYVKATYEQIESAASNEACALLIGIGEYSNNLKIYPNPANSVINIEGIDIEKITIINSMGQIVKSILYSANIIQIDVSNFASGNYVFSILFSNNSTENIKIIIN